MITYRFKPLSVLVVIALVITLGVAALPSHIALGACPTTLNLTLLNDPHLLVDSNNPAVGPQVTAAYATINNTGAATAYDVYMYIGNGTTPGTFAAGSDGQKLSMLGSVADATRFIGNLAPGESKTVYWMLKYPLTNGKTYPMTIWASNPAGCSVQGSHTFTTQSTISASADKMLGTVTLNPADGQVHVGNILTVTVTGFNFGVIGSNGDAWLQPVGNLDFNPDQFRLIKTEVNIHSIAGVCGYGSMPVYDRLYFPGIRTCYSFNATDYVKYYFVATSEGTTTAKVYQEAASGAQEKYSVDYGKPGATVTFTAHCGGITLWKSVNPQTATANTTLNWTITYRNDSGLPIGDPGTGNGLTVREDAIPANTTYVANSTTCSGSCIIYYSTDNGVTWTTAEPAPSNVTRIKWFINQVIPAGSSGTVSFQSKVNSDVISTPLICNSASAGVGDCPFAPTDTVCANSGADLDLIKVVNDHHPCELAQITYTVTVSNPSTSNATGVNVTDLLPFGLTYVSSSTSQGTYNSSTGLWNLGNLNASSNATLNLTASVNAGTGGTTIINWGNITGADQMDPVLLNNSDHDGITVHAAPTAYPASNSPVCEGATIYLFGGPGGMTSYNWTGPGGFSSTEQNPERSIATSAMAGTYNLTVTDSSGCGSAGNTTNVTVNANPVAMASSNSPVCEGATIQLYGGPDGMFSYSWTGPGGWASDVQNVTLGGATTAMAGTYNLTVNNGCTASNTTSVTVNVKPVATASSNSPVFEGATIQLYGGPDGMTSYNWTGPGGWTNSTQNATRPNATTAMAGTYSLTVTNSDGCTDDASASVTVTATTATGLPCDPVCKGLMISSTEGGSVTTPGEGAFPCFAGTVIDLVASPDPGYKFVNWTGNVATIADVHDASTTITMEGWYSITANFEKEATTLVQYDLTVSSTAGGSVTSPGVGTFTYDAGTSVSLVAKPATGYQFVNWTGSVSAILNSNAASTTITMNGDCSIKANFKETTTPDSEEPFVFTGCFIATAAYGTPMAKEIGILRQFRDEYLLTNPVGKTLVDLYYRVSPPLAEFITEHPSLKPVVRVGLLPAVAMSIVAVNTTPSQKVAILGLLVLIPVALAIWARRRRDKGPKYASG